MMVGLQGSGKTTTTAKIAKYIEKNNKKSDDGKSGYLSSSSTRTIKIIR